MPDSDMATTGPAAGTQAPSKSPPNPPVTRPERPRVWKRAKDPRTGRTYYYDVHTRETQWEKPLELATPEERHRIREKERQTKEFFRAMEANILRKVNQGMDIHDVQPPQEETAPVKPAPHRRSATPLDLAAPVDYMAGEESKYKAYPDFWGTIRRPTSKPRRMVRTISHMDDSVLEQLKTTENEDLSAKEARSLEELLEDLSIAEGESTAPAPNAPMGTAPVDRKRHNIMSAFFGGDKGVRRNESRKENSRPRRHSTVQTRKLDQTVGRTTRVSLETLDLGDNPPPLRRNNSTSTIYVNETMAAPDKDATIKAVCCVIRAHMLSAAARDDAHTLDTVPSEFRILVDRDYVRPKPKRPSFSRFVRSVSDEVEVPKLDTIVKFFRHVYLTAQMEVECIIMSLIYVEKLLKETDGGLQIRHFNWKSILFAGMIMASKVWDDLSMWNVDFSAVCPSFSLHRINELELVLLGMLKFNTTIQASTYAKYYFHLRSMCVAMGLGGDLRSIQPLAVEDAQRLHICSAKYGDKNNLSMTVRARASTLEAPPSQACAARPPLDGSAESHLRKNSQTKPRLSLEEVISVSPDKGGMNSLFSARGATP